LTLSGAWRSKPLFDSTKPEASASAQPSSELAVAAPLQIELTANLPARPESIASDPAGGIWELSDGRVLRVVLATGNASPPLDLGGHRATAMVLRRNLLWIASRDGNSVFEVDSLTGDVVATSHVDAPTALAVDTSTVIEGPGQRVAGQTPAPIRGPSIVVASSATNSIIEYSADTMTERWHQAVPGTPILAAEGGGRIWVAARPAGDPTAVVLAAYEAGTGRPVGMVRFPVGARIPRSIAVQQVGADVGSAWIPDPTTGLVSVIDARATGVVRTIEVGAGVAEIAVRPGGDFVVTYADGSAKPGTANALAVIHVSDGSVVRYVVRQDTPGSGQGVVGLSFEDETDESNARVGTFWKVWFGMDWDGGASVGRVNEYQLP
ncbi:MAG TPA: hypothetical protein VF484_08710, partial [Candidatus Limnocylindrales bacterium]